MTCVCRGAVTAATARNLHKKVHPSLFSPSEAVSPLSNQRANGGICQLLAGFFYSKPESHPLTGESYSAALSSFFASAHATLIAGIYYPSPALLFRSTYLLRSC